MKLGIVERAETLLIAEAVAIELARELDAEAWCLRRWARRLPAGDPVRGELRRRAVQLERMSFEARIKLDKA